MSGPVASSNCSGLEQEILDLYFDLPDRKALKIWAPATESGPEVLVELSAQRRMFAASTLKSVILCERLRQLDSADIEEKIRKDELPLDNSVWSPGSDIFNPPDLSGLVSERTARRR